MVGIIGIARMIRLCQVENIASLFIMLLVQ